MKEVFVPLLVEGDSNCIEAQAAVAALDALNLKSRCEQG